MGLLLLWNGSVQGTAGTFPTIYLEWSPTTGPAAAPAWERIPLADIRSIDINRGRNRELDQFQAGRMTVVLDNRDRLYDPQYSAGANFGNVKPMKRIRLRAVWDTTYDLFTGFVDSWDQNYDMTDEAVCLNASTDSFKVAAGTDLPVSVYYSEVAADDPSVWLRLDDTQKFAQTSLTAVNSGTLGSAANGTFTGPPTLGGAGLINGDPGTSMVCLSPDVNTGVGWNGVIIDDGDFDLVKGGQTWAAEVWALPQANAGAGSIWLIGSDAGAGTPHVQVAMQLAGGVTRFYVQVDDGVNQFEITEPTDSDILARHHVVVKFKIGEPLRLWVDGTRTDDGVNLSGFSSVHVPITVGYYPSPSLSDGEGNWIGPVSNAAFYIGDAAEAVDDDWVTRHLEAGTAPWNGDTTGERIERMLDLLGIAEADRNVDTGDSTLQSAELSGSVLGHMNLVRDTEYGELFVTPDGKFRFVSRSSRWRPPYSDPLFTLSDDGSDLGYGRLKFNYDDQLIRNEATIGYSNGFTYTANSTSSQDDFLVKSYSLTGLIGDVDSEAVDYANYIVARYDEPLLRVEGISITPQKAPATMWPSVLAADLVYQVNVERTPQGIGTAIDQDYTIEGVSHHIEPKFWRTELQLSPADTPGAFILDSTSQGILDTNTLGW